MNISPYNCLEIKKHFLNNMKEIVQMLKDNKIRVIIGGVYPNNFYGPKEYQTLLEVNKELKELAETIDFLSKVDDGKGHWKEGYDSDLIHPNSKGHLEMFKCINLDTFTKK